MENKREVTPNILWAFGERICAQLVTLIVSIVLARILSPGEYASVAIVMIFITLANVFVSSGYGIALIQKKDSDNYDFSTTLYFSLFLSLVFYGVLFFAAPFISTFFNSDLLTNVIRVLGIRLVFASINTVQHAYVSKQMAFRKFFFSTLIGTIVSSVIGIAMALCGFGVWAIVAQYLSNTIIDTIVLSITSGWRPKIYFSFKRFRALFPFGSAVLFVDLISTTYTQLRGLLLGRFYEPTELSCYNQAEKYSAVFVTNIETSINKVMTQVQSDAQDRIEIIKQNTRKTIRFVMAIIAPIQIGLAVLAPNWVVVLLGEKWAGAIPYVVMTAIFYLLYPLIETHTRNIKALGRGKSLLILHSVRYGVGVGIMLLCLFLSDKAWVLCLASIPTQLFAVLLFSFFDSKLTKYSFSEQIRDIFPVIVSVSIMGFVVFLEGYLPLGEALVLLLQVFTGLILYSILSYLFMRDEFNKVSSFFKNIIFRMRISGKKTKRKIKFIFIASSILIVAGIGGASVYYRSIDSNNSNLINLSLENYTRDEFSISKRGRNSYVLSGHTDKNVSVIIGNGMISSGKYMYKGIYASSESDGNVRLQLFSSKSGSSYNNLLCQFGGCTDKEYSFVNFESFEKCYVQSRLIIYAGWKGKIEVTPFLQEISKESKCSVLVNGTPFKKPIMTIIDDDGHDDFIKKWVPVMQEYNIPITCAAVTKWIEEIDTFMNWEELKYAEECGAEIVCHSETHDNNFYNLASVDEIIASYTRAKKKFFDHGFTTDSIVYNGNTGDKENVRIAGSHVFDIGIHSGGNMTNNKSNIDLFNIKRYNLITENRNFEYYKTIIDDCVQKGGWLVWMSHSHYDELDKELLGIVCEAIEYAKRKDIDIVNVYEGYQRISQ